MYGGDSEDINVEIVESNTEIENLQQQAKQLSKEYDKQIDETSNYDDPLAGIMPMEKYYSINVEMEVVQCS